MALADTRYSQRRRTLSARLAGQRIDMMLVTNLIHVQYLSGFTGSNAALMLSKDLNPQISTDGRYTTQVAEEVPDIEALIARPCAEALLSRVEGPRRVGIEADEISVAQWEALKKAAGEDVTLVPVRGVVEELRLIKDHRELESLREVAELASQAYRDLLAAGELAVGRSERDIAADLEYRMRKAGAERTSFDTIIASGPNSAKPHHGAGDRLLQSGDLVTLDFGAFLGGFNSDMTRTVVMGKADEFSTEIYEVVKRAQAAGVEAATVGTALADVDRATREIIEEAGYGEYYVHSTGHGVGLEVHEGPYASSAGEGELREGMTLTIEPGIYVPGRGGVRIEDTLIITPGAPEVITRVSKDLTVL
ncbi:MULTISPECIES: aminopeptidase P family protein [unclassified Corynebacterium]|uniref:aminopeptidase P family protein n=1 Tax=unclassified Corynebacterium TaxID=2624378 RepID=UPI0029CA121C|nr:MULTISPECIES: aminopeptidase P family protein [unclassified Corynebacterium]WPF65164.1 aminopeptidase P family protein [Corynebacterium sp. 22KM0430]WPF67660.1 aminopeptidase P family protein [Corynebacterium sp. 21KM1197]